ncbi:hypothetical protein ACSLNR_28155, partial [Escherichia coli]
QNRNANFSTYWQQRKKTTYRHRRANENRRSKNESREKNNDGNYNATAAVYQKVVTLEDKLVEKPVTGKSRKN